MVARLSRDDLKNRILEHLRATPRTQYENVMEIGLERPLGRRLSETETQDVLEILHELLTANILMPASNRRSAGWPFFGLTTHGQEVIRASGPPVYDYEGYLADLRGRIPGLDAVIERFLTEALQAYQRQLFLCSVAMLGCASERGIWSLIDTYLTAIKDVTNRDKLRSRIAGRDISVAYRRFRESFDSVQGQLPASLTAEFDVHIDALFTFTRLLRNAVMHPAEIPTITHAVAYASLQQFSYYLPTLSEVTRHLETTGITV
jgi:hypothetical protein